MPKWGSSRVVWNGLAPVECGEHERLAEKGESTCEALGGFRRFVDHALTVIGGDVSCPLRKQRADGSEVVARPASYFKEA